MVESLNANLMAELRSGAFKPIYIVEIKIAPPDLTENEDGSYTYFETENSYAFISGGAPRFGYQAVVGTVSPISAELDPLTRKMTPAGVEVTFVEDGPVRDLNVDYTLRGQKLLIYLGTPNLDEEDFEQRFEGSITEVLPSPDGSLHIFAEDWRASQSDTVTYGFTGKDPYTILRDLVRDKTGASVNEATFVAPASKSHWFTAISVEDSDAWSPASALFGATESGSPVEFGIDELVFLLGGCLRTRFPSAQTEWLEFDTAAAAVATFTRDDVMLVEQRESNEFRKNTFHTSLSGSMQFRETGKRDLVEKELYLEKYDAQALARTRGEKRIHDFESRLFHNRATVLAVVNGEDEETIWWNADIDLDEPGFCPFNEDTVGFVLYSPTYCGISGSATDNTGALSAPLDATHVAYFLLVGSGHIECVSCDATELFAPAPDHVINADVVGVLSGANYPEYTRPQNVLYTIKERGLFGYGQHEFFLRTPRKKIVDLVEGTEADVMPADASELWAFDITVIVEALQRNLTRFRDGIPILDLTAHPEHINKEYGDTVTLQHGLALDFRIDGADSNQIFEIIRKEEQLDADPPCVLLTLALHHSLGATLDHAELYRLQRQVFNARTQRSRALSNDQRNLYRHFSRGGGILT